MIAQNFTDELPQRILGDKTAVRAVLWVISTLALVSNLALIATRICTHARRQRPLGVFIVGLAISNLFVTISVTILLVVASRQSPKDDSSALGQGTWSQSVCSPVYFLKHFGIYSLVIILSFIVLERFTRLGYRLCISPELSARRSAVYVCEAWVLSFLLIIPPWTRVTSWHKFCTASYEMAFAEAMYIACGILVLGVCLSALVQVVLIFWRRICTLKSDTHQELRMDLRLILAGVMTFALLGVPHVAFAITHVTGGKSRTEVVTILLGLACLLIPLLFMNYWPSNVRMSDTLSTKNIECTCEKCTVKQFYPTEYSLDSLDPANSSDQSTAYSEDKPRFRTPASSEQRMSADSLLDLDTWATRSTKTKSWIESCDYDDLKKLQAKSWVQRPKHEAPFRGIKQRTLTWSDRCGEKSNSTSGVNDVSSIASSYSERASTSSGHARSLSERERSLSDHTASSHKRSQRSLRVHQGVLTRAPEVETAQQESVTATREGMTENPEILTVIHDADGGKTCDQKQRSKRLSSFRDLIQRALSPKRQRSKSLPDNPVMYVKKVERSQSAPFAVMTVDKNAQTLEVPAKSNEASAERRTEESTYMDRLASFFILAPAKSPRNTRKPLLSPGKARPVGVVSPISSSFSQKSLIGERLGRSSSIGQKSPLHEPAIPAKSIALEAGDILTELPVMRRQRLKTKPRDPMARISTGSTGSTGSTTARLSLEWDPIGSVEGYDEHEVLPPYPPMSTKTHQEHSTSKVSRPIPQLLEAAKTMERTSLYSLDWDPTSVQLRNSVVSRDSLRDSSDDEGQLYDIEDCTEGSKGKTVWV